MSWPESIAPFKVHLLFLGKDAKIKAVSDKLYDELQQAGIEVLYDDREESAGVKLNDSDLLGMPYRIVVSEKTLAQESIEFKQRNQEKMELIKLNQIVKKLT